MYEDLYFVSTSDLILQISPLTTGSKMKLKIYPSLDGKGTKKIYIYEYSIFFQRRNIN